MKRYHADIADCPICGWAHYNMPFDMNEDLARKYMVRQEPITVLFICPKSHENTMFQADVIPA